MSREIRFKKQYKPIGFGDRPDPGTVEGHRNAMDEAAETRRYNRRMKELAAEDVAKRDGWLSRILSFMSSRIRRKLLARK
jgi:hypothetical protein